MKFNIVIKLLLDITNTKSKEFASFVEFDNSYISKWLSGNRLPSNKSLESILQKSSEFFAKKVYENNLQEELAQISLYKLRDGSLSSIQDAIYRILKKSYLNSKEDIERPKLTVDPKSFVAYGREEVINKGFRALAEAIYAAKHDLDIYTTFDFPEKLGPEVVTKMNLQSMANKTVRTHFVSNIKKSYYKTDEEFYSSFLFTLVGTSLNGQWYLSDHDEDVKIVFCDNKFVMLFTLTEDFEPFMSYTEDAATIESVRRVLIPKFSNNITISSNQDERLYLQRMIRDDGEVTIFSIYPSGLFLNNILDNHTTPAMESIKFHNAVNIYNQILTECKFNLFITERGVEEFMKNGKLTILDQMLVLDEEERIEYLKCVVDNLHENHNFKVYFIRDSHILENFDSINISIFCNNKYLFFKKHLSYHNDYPDVSLYKYMDNQDLAYLHHQAVKSFIDREGSVFEVNHENADEIFESLMTQYREKGIID